MDLDKQLRTLILLATAEDGKEDITSQAIFTGEEEAEAVIVANQDGIVCGIPFLEKIMHSIDEDVLIDPFVDEGDEIKDRMMLGSIEGKVTSLLRVERILLNFLSRLSGIATITHEFVEAVEGTGAVILDTRKTVPAWRLLDKYAVKIGGGINHRMNLEDLALIKDTHVDAVGGVGLAIDRFRENEGEKPLIVEVRNQDELREALDHHKSLNRIILDNFSVEEMLEAVEMASGRILLEASGGITLENAREIAETGVHFLSVGKLTHSVQAFDFSFKIS